MLRLALTLCLMAGPALADDIQCAMLTDMQADLAEQFGERQVGIGLDSRGFLMMLYLSDAGTWTMIYTTPDGQACMAAAGTDMMLVPATEVFGEHG